MSHYRDTARIDTLILHCATTSVGEWWTATHMRSLSRCVESPRVIGHCDAAPDNTRPGFGVASWFEAEMVIPADAPLRD